MNPHNGANVQYQLNPAFGPGSQMPAGQQGMINYNMGIKGMRPRHLTAVNIMPNNLQIPPQQLQLQQQQIQQQQMQQQMQMQQQQHWPQQFLIQQNNPNNIPFTGKLMNGYITNAPQPFISKDNLAPSPIIFQPNYSTHPEHKVFQDGGHVPKKEHKKNKTKETRLSPISDYEADDYGASNHQYSNTHSSSKKSKVHL